MSLIPIFTKQNFTVVRLVKQAIKEFNLRPVKQLEVKFDPFSENVASARQFIYQVSHPRVQYTNPNCKIKTIIVNDRSEPTISFNLNNGETVVIKSTNFTVLELLGLYRKHIASKFLPPEDAVPTVVPRAIKIKGQKAKKF